jgi:hypothetical protein
MLQLRFVRLPVVSTCVIVHQWRSMAAGLHVDSMWTAVVVLPRVLHIWLAAETLAQWRYMIFRSH